ncbi:porin [Mangrovimonas xylaniphaga]|uniref:porin n=1 Tax=Mangrovimonas xylaniphaga TaxID=1645915 RepID=UPI0006B5CC39|nr:porin [Mangrovimonas xylaniphaga]
MHLRTFSITLLALLLFCNLRAQEKTKKSDTLQLIVKPYGSFRGHMAVFERELEFQENASRIGLNIDIKAKGVTFFMGSELQLKMFKGNLGFNADANLSGGFLVADSPQSEQVFGSRLGYLGFDLKQYGKFTFGKQWSVFYDVTGLTDCLNVFGGRGSPTYYGGTDGGTLGTGRADQAFVYRNSLGPVSLGLQIQARSATNNKFFDSYGASLRIKFLKHFLVSGAYNKAYLNETLIEDHLVLGLEGQPQYYAFGLQYKDKKLQLAAVLSHQNNGDLTHGVLIVDSEITSPSVVFDATGFEFYGRYQYHSAIFIVGYNLYNPETKEISAPDGQKPVVDGFKIEDLILGAEYRPLKRAYFYSEYRISNGRSSLGVKDYDVFTIGIRINIEKTYKTKIKKLI